MYAISILAYSLGILSRTQDQKVFRDLYEQLLNILAQKEKNFLEVKTEEVLQIFLMNVVNEQETHSVNISSYSKLFTAL